MSQLKILSPLDTAPSRPGKFKPDKFSTFTNHFLFHSLPKLTPWSSFFLAIILFFFLLFAPSTSRSSNRRHLDANWGDHVWELRVIRSARLSSRFGSFIVLEIGAAAFVGTHVSLELKQRGDDILGLDNFNRYYDPALKRSHQKLLENASVFVVEGDANNIAVLKKLFELVSFTRVIHSAAQIS